MVKRIKRRITTDYRKEAKMLEERVQRRIGPGQPLTQKDIINYLKKGNAWSGTSAQEGFINMITTHESIQSYTRKNKQIKSYTRTHSSKNILFKKIWTPQQENYLHTHSLKESRIMFQGQFTPCAIYNKRRRILGKKK